MTERLRTGTTMKRHARRVEYRKKYHHNLSYFYAWVLLSLVGCVILYGGPNNQQPIVFVESKIPISESSVDVFDETFDNNNFPSSTRRRNKRRRRITTRYQLLHDHQSRQLRPSNIVDDSIAHQRSSTHEQAHVHAHAQIPTTRIVGGQDAPHGRYPYNVMLVDKVGILICGGTLIAPDVVLTVVYCEGFTRAQIGRYNRTDFDTSTFDDIPITLMVDHPFSSGTGIYEYRIVKLERPTARTPIRLNTNPGVPTGNVPNELLLMGFGATNFTNDEIFTLPYLLQQVRLDYIPNEVCEQARDPYNEEEYLREGYTDSITDDMLCAQGDQRDACEGDSGSPLILPGASPQQDLLVGISSWGFGCATPGFPGVYSRISDQVDWIQSAACALSSVPPTEFSCASRESPPTGDPITITVSIKFDDWPDETGWILVEATNYAVMANRPAGYYDDDSYIGRTVQEDLTLVDGASYLFSIHDLNGDGMSEGGGQYEIIVKDTGLVLESIEIGENFGLVRTVDFVAARAPTSEPSQSPSDIPSASPSTSPSAAPSTSPSDVPSASPSVAPSASPTLSMAPSAFPSDSPTESPSESPSRSPTEQPSESPSSQPSISSAPSKTPSGSPSQNPTEQPSQSPSSQPSTSSVPSASPSESPTDFPTTTPGPTDMPSSSPTMQPSSSQRPTTHTPYPSISPSTAISVASPIQAEALEDAPSIPSTATGNNMFPTPPTTVEQIPVVGKPDGTTADDGDDQSARPPFMSSIFQPSDSFPEIISVGAVNNNTNVSSSIIASTDGVDDGDGGDEDPASGGGRSFQHHSHHFVDTIVLSFMIVYIGCFLIWF
mmetsp:Transcript_50602/g.122109  ORF Transcript_50602/g.122109 Transcript_50602/m.122109 type:complete len:832 (-) Transcript_50602:50-2545(-)